MIFYYLTVLESFLIIFHEKKPLLLYPSSLIHFQNHYISKGLIFNNLYNRKKKVKKTHVEHPDNQKKSFCILFMLKTQCPIQETIIKVMFCSGKISDHNRQSAQRKMPPGVNENSK